MYVCMYVFHSIDATKESCRLSWLVYCSNKYPNAVCLDYICLPIKTFQKVLRLWVEMDDLLYANVVICTDLNVRISYIQNYIDY